MDKVTLNGSAMKINTETQVFDMRNISNRRFLFNPKTKTLILGEVEHGRKLVSTHFQDHSLLGGKESFNDFVSGWVGNGNGYENGVIHFTPPLPPVSSVIYNIGFPAIEMFRKNGATGKTVLRGFWKKWEMPLGEALD